MFRCMFRSDHMLIRGIDFLVASLLCDIFCARRHDVGFATRIEFSIDPSMLLLVCWLPDHGLSQIPWITS